MKPSCKHNHLSDLCEICNSAPMSKETQQDTDTWSEGGTEYRKREGFIEARNALNPDWIVVDKDGSTYIESIMNLQETIEAVGRMLETQKDLLKHSQKMSDPGFNKLDTKQWDAIHEEDERAVAALSAALHWLNKC